MSPFVTFVLALITQLPGDIAAVEAAVANVKGALAAPDLATLTSIFAALNAKTDADVAAFDHDAQAQGATQ